ncbi:hypothetical protein ACFVS2_25790 [Brevibacillus sp. NPDC058079]|uniref:hypothetical protein n=1 Tax=Brevibacillus sp. NPDC058079 TaxID=3346330 RepID=UPI0036E41025
MLFRTLKKRIKELLKLDRAENGTAVIYEEGKMYNDSQVILFQNQNEVEIFKLEEEKRRIEAEIEQINVRLKPWEEEMRRKHRELWNY